LHGSSAAAAGPDDESDKEAEAARERRRAPRDGRDSAEMMTIRLGSWGDRGPSVTIGGGSGMIEGSGRRATRTVDLRDFNSIRIDRVIQADVTRGDSFQVGLTADDNILEKIEVAREGSTLRIGLAPGRYRLKEKARAAITLPVLERIELAGASGAALQGFDSARPFGASVGGASRLEGSIRAGDVDLNVDGASTLKLRTSARAARLHAGGASTLELSDFVVSAERLTIAADGASTVRLRGSARAAALKAEGGSRLHLVDFALDAADVELGGASNATIRVKDLLNYEVNSASRLQYLGDPTIRNARKGAGSSVSPRR
jgi:hypothetical protein